jgi:hypothetical protein
MGWLGALIHRAGFFDERTQSGIGRVGPVREGGSARFLGDRTQFPGTGGDRPGPGVLGLMAGFGRDYNRNEFPRGSGDESMSL